MIFSITQNIIFRGPKQCFGWFTLEFRKVICFGLLAFRPSFFQPKIYIALSDKKITLHLCLFLSVSDPWPTSPKRT